MCSCAVWPVSSWPLLSRVCVLRTLQAGSVAHIMRYKFRDGLQEAVIATIMKQVCVCVVCAEVLQLRACLCACAEVPDEHS
jgi:hypothetical protein